MPAVAKLHPRVQVQTCLSFLTALHACTGSFQTICQKELAAVSVALWREDAVVSRVLLSSFCKLYNRWLSNMLGASWACPDEEYSRLVGFFLVTYPSFLSISTKTSGNVTCLTPKSRMALSCWGLNHVVLFKGFLGSCVSLRSMEPCLFFDELRNIPVIVVDHYHWRQHLCLTI